MKKILVCHDGSDAADKALMEAISISGLYGATLTILSVVPNLCFTEIGVDCDTVGKLYRAEIEGGMEGINSVLQKKAVKAETIILEGNPADVIVDHARGMGVDLVVVGSTGKQATARTIIGSVTSRVVANAPCSVLVVK